MVIDMSESSADPADLSADGLAAELGSADLASDDLVDVLADRLARRRSLVPGPDADCGLDADCPPDQICLDGHCT